MLVLFGVKVILTNSVYIQGMFKLSFFSKLKEIQQSLFSSLIANTVVLTDGFVPNDEILNSTIGKSNGDFYRNVLSKIYSVEENIGKKDNWNQVMSVRNLIK